DRITRTGSMPKAIEEPDFITSDDPWFRPVDLRMGPGGALFVADFYNKVIGHYEVPLTHPGRDKERGRIWRITKKQGAMDMPALSGPVVDLRFAARKGALSAREVETAGRFLESADAEERKVAVEAMLRPISVEWLPKLVALLERTPAEDLGLRHQLRIVIRGHLRLPGAIKAMEGLAMSPATKSEVIMIARAAGFAEAAGYVLQQMKADPACVADAAEALTQLAVYLPAGDLMEYAKGRFANDAGMQADLLLAVNGGLQERGELPPAPVLGWGNEVAGKLLASLPQGNVPSWTNVPGNPPTVSPWGMEERKKPDGAGGVFISSLASGQARAEQAGGTLVSKPFAAPDKLSFAVCGHDGSPERAAVGGNFVRLVDAASGAEIQRAAPPRNDASRKVEWDLSAVAGKSVRLEIVDGVTEDAYAWLAVGEVDPPVVVVEAFRGEAEATRRLTKLAGLLKYAAPPMLREKLAVFLPAAPPAPPSAVTPEQQAEADRLIAARVAGFAAARPDKGRGESVFAANCAVCHAIGGKGALVGPQLDGIGNRGAARLCEDILDPGRNVDSHFRLHVVTAQDESVVAGLERGEAGQVLIMVDAAGQEHRLVKSTIKKNEETAMSLMPAIFGMSIPEADFYDLMAWLLSQSSKP
ncbi:MAG: hypothetical protein JWL81_1228, partial [Verrucomicrobiales bacterium]|nr:hypothetical protein [Verrucomicrobiales bacterium]